MKRLRLTDISLYYHVKNILHKESMNTIDEGAQANIYRTEVPYYVKVMDEYPDVYKEDIVLPTLAVDHSVSDEAGLQIGGGYWSFRDFQIHIFASTDAERDDLSEIIYEGFDQGTHLRDFNVGFPEYLYNSISGLLEEYFPGPVAPAISDLDILEKSIRSVPRTSPAEVDAHRATIICRTLALR